MKPLGCLFPLAVLYQAAAQTRNRLFDLGVLTQQGAGVPVISVGNLSVGGTGKTPFVIYLARRIGAQHMGRKFRIGVVSRGYRGSSRGTTAVSDGRRVLSTPAIAGDEPVLIAGSTPGCIVIVDNNRLRGAKFAINEYKANLILLDDGFQHRSIKRDLDIVLLDGQNPLGNRLTLPAGNLREPVSALKRAGLIVLSKVRGSDDELHARAQRLEKLLARPVAAARLKPTYWRKVGGGEMHAADVVGGKKVVAFAGIARPDSFIQTVIDLGGDAVSSIAFPDHCKYSKSQLDRVAGEYVRCGAEWLVTTAKDAVKLPGILHLLPVYYLEAEMELVAGESRLDEMLKAATLESKRGSV